MTSSTDRLGAGAGAAPAATDWQAIAMQRRVRRRYAADRRFRAFGLIAVLMSLGFLAYLLVTMLASGWGGFVQTRIALPIDFVHAGGAETNRVTSAGIDARARRATTAGAIATFGAGGDQWLSSGAWRRVAELARRNPAMLHRVTIVAVPAGEALDSAAKHGGTAAATTILARLRARGRLSSAIDIDFLTATDSTDPTSVGIWGAFKGSLLTMIVTLLLAFPVGVFAALYLEEYAPRNRWTDMIEVSINNLAAVPSIIFGLLGLAVFLGTFHLPRSAPLVGGMTLALMTMPVIVIAGRNAVKAVPPSIRDAAFAVGASPVQVVFNHVLPLALPGMLTGTIIGMARALGETAPLLMIGMRAFIATAPDRLTDPATVLPVQIFLWSDQVSRGFVEKTSAAILVLLVFLLAMNGLAIYLRQKFEIRW